MPSDQVVDKFDFVFQNKVLALLILDEDFLAKYGPIVKPEYFTDIHHQLLCDFVNKYFGKYEHKPSVDVLIESIDKTPNPEKRDFLATALEECLTTDLEDATYYEDRVVSFCKRQAVVLALRDAGGKLRDGEMDSILPTIEQSFLIGESISYENLGSAFWDCFSTEEITRSGPKVATLMGAPGSGGLDDALRGGLEVGNVGCVMMPTGRGKSIWLVNMAGNAVVQGVNTLFVTLELEERTIVQRFNSFFTGLDQETIKNMGPQGLEDTMAAKMYNLEYGELQIKMFPNKSATVRQIEAYIKMYEAKAQKKIGLVCIDYLDILKAPYNNREKHERLEDIADELKALAQRIKVPVWTASQANRSGAQKEIITNEDSSGSYAKIFPLDVVITSAPKLDRDTDERNAVLFIAKNRQGFDQRTIDFELDTERMRFLFRDRVEVATANNVSMAYNKFMKGIRK